MSRTVTIPAIHLDPRLPANRLAAAAVVRLDDAATPAGGERREWLTKVQRVYFDPKAAAAEAARLSITNAEKGSCYFVCPTQIELPAGDAPAAPEKD